MLKLPAIVCGLAQTLLGLVFLNFWLIVPGLVILALGLFYFRLDFGTAANDSWAKTVPHIRGLPGSESLCERVDGANPPWPAISEAMSYCAGFPSKEFAELLASGNFDVRWPLTFAAWHWGASGSSVDQACADFLSKNGLWEKALEVLPEYSVREWLPGWRAQFEKHRCT